MIFAIIKVIIPMINFVVGIGIIKFLPNFFIIILALIRFIDTIVTSIALVIAPTLISLMKNFIYFGCLILLNHL